MNEELIDVGVVHGRFQPLHIGHVEYLLAGKRRCRKLIIGITNPDPWQVADEPTSPHRAAATANPFTYYERYLMVDGTMRENGVSPGDYRIVPFPHSFPDRLCHYVPDDAVFLLTIYDEWGEEKLHRFTRIGRQSRVLWRRTSTATSGTDIRRRITHGHRWEHLVPDATVRVVRTVPLRRIMEGAA